MHQNNFSDEHEQYNCLLGYDIILFNFSWLFQFFREGEQ